MAPPQAVASSTSDQRVRVALWYTLGVLTLLVLSLVAVVTSFKAALRPTAPILDLLGELVTKGALWPVLGLAVVSAFLGLLR